jgi:hypothetical protein
LPPPHPRLGVVIVKKAMHPDSHYSEKLHLTAILREGFKFFSPSTMVAVVHHECGKRSWATERPVLAEP